jgi:hypothetical protein
LCCGIYVFDVNDVVERSEVKMHGFVKYQCKGKLSMFYMLLCTQLYVPESENKPTKHVEGYSIVENYNLHLRRRLLLTRSNQIISPLSKEIVSLLGELVSECLGELPLNDPESNSSDRALWYCV